MSLNKFCKFSPFHLGFNYFVYSVHFHFSWQLVNVMKDILIPYKGIPFV